MHHFAYIGLPISLLLSSLTVAQDAKLEEQDAKAVAFQKGSKETCLTCHNEKSPTFKGFNYEEYWAKIAHPTPEK